MTVFRKYNILGYDFSGSKIHLTMTVFRKFTFGYDFSGSIILGYDFSGSITLSYDFSGSITLGYDFRKHNTDFSGSII